MQDITTEPGRSTKSELQLQDIHKRFGDTLALQGVSFFVSDQEIVGLLGPSGCGKSTVLSVIAGLESPDRGVVKWNGKSLEDIPTHKRGFGLMFQDFALFPHQDTYNNIAFGLRMQGISQEGIRERVEDVLSLVGLPGIGRRDVSTLSGGEAQRVALARALAPNPRLLMLDEPLGALDRNLRERLMVDLREILRQCRQTAIYVTHDQEEAFTVADRIILMNAGQVAQVGRPVDIYRHPKTEFVARFLGLDNLMPGQIVRTGDNLGVETSIGIFYLNLNEVEKDLDQNESIKVLLRPDSVHLDGIGESRVKGVIKNISFRGKNNRALIQIGELLFGFDFPAYIDLPEVGMALELSFNPQAAIQILR